MTLFGDIAKWDLLYARYYTELNFGIVFFCSSLIFQQIRIKNQ